jgi:IclR family acetate operon transcriptional repressor
MKSAVDGTGSVPGSRTIDRAFRALDSFTLTEPRWRTTDLAEHCALPVPTTHRILRMLERFGYVVRDSAGEYSLGPTAAGFDRAEGRLEELRRMALPQLRAVGRATGERASLVALAESRDHAREVCAIDPAPEAGALGRGSSSPRPLHAGASCKALLAQLGDEDLARALARGLEPVGPATITRPARLRRELAAIRRRGWAFSCEETAASTWAVAVPLPAPTPCALAVSASVDRCNAERARRHVSVLARGARWLSNRLEDERAEPFTAAGAAA